MKLVPSFGQRYVADKPAQPARRRRRRWPLIVGGLVLVALIAGAAWQMRVRAATTTPQRQTVAVTQGDLQVTIQGSGSVQPARTVDLSFQSSGQVSDVLVKAGDTVTKGQTLATIDNRDLQLQVQQAEANLKTAQVKLAQTKNGNATPQDLAQAQASVNSAKANLQQTRTGNTTVADLRNAQAAIISAQAKLNQVLNGNASASDIASAEANVRAAQAKLDALKNPSPDKLSAAQTTLAQAQSALQTTQTSAAANKEKANQAQAQAADAVRIAQQAYSDAYWSNQQAQNGIDPKTGKSFADEKLDAATQQRTYATALQNATLQLSQAQASLEQAKVAYGTAKQQEITDVQQAEVQVKNAEAQLAALQNPNQSDITQAQAQVDQAQAALTKLKSGGTASDITIARASLAQAQSQYDKLKQGATPAQIAAAQAQIDSANAALQKLTAPATETDIEAAQAGVDQAQASLDAAKLALDRAALTAPFDGVIGAVNIVPGSNSGGGSGGSSSTSSAPITLIDRSSMYINLSLSESDVAKVQPGQDVTITFDALPEAVLKGKVDSVAPTSTTTQNVTTYGVKVTFDPGSTPIKVGMTANTTVTVQTVQGALLVPNRAIRTQGGVKSVQLLYGNQKLPVTVPVQTGATDGSQIVVTSCTDTGNQCLKPGDQLVVASSTATSTTRTTTTPQRPAEGIPFGGGGGGGGAGH